MDRLHRPATGRLNAPRSRSRDARTPVRLAIAAAAVLALVSVLPVSASAQAAPWDQAALEATCEANATTPEDLATCRDIVRRVLAPGPGGAGEETTFAPISMRGSGDKVVRFDKPEGVTVLVDIRHRGKGPFSVAALDRDGILNAWLVQDRGRYRGRVLLDVTPPPDQPCVATCPDDDSEMLEITAGGRWVISMEPLVAAREWRTPEPLAGEGDSVVRLDEPVAGLATTTVLNAEEGSALLVWPYAADGGVRLLGDETLTSDLRTGSQLLLPDGTAILQIRARGPWTLGPLEPA